MEDERGLQTILGRYISNLQPTVHSRYMFNTSKTFAIVGTTGFLGPHIVASLLDKHKNSNIFCLNRKSDGKQRTEAALRTIMTDFSNRSAQLHFWIIDIAEPNLGLTPQQVASLTSNIDELIFNAWDPRWDKKLVHFECFLRGIRHAVDLCTSAHRHPRIIFVSSICAVGNWPIAYPKHPKIPEAVIWDDRSAMPHGYGESKYLAEHILAKAKEVSNLPVSIVRAGQIGGPSTPGKGVWPRQGWLYSIISTSTRLRAFPTNAQALDWIPVDTLADGIANITLRWPSTSDEVFNAVHPNPAPWALLYKTLQDRFGLRAAEERLPDWLDRFDPARMKLHGFLRKMGDGRERNMDFENRKALEVLAPIPAITEDLLERWLSDWILAPVDSGAKL